MLINKAGLERVCARGEEHNLHAILQEIYGSLPKVYETRDLVYQIPEFRRTHALNDMEGHRGLPFKGSRLDRVSETLYLYCVNLELQNQVAPDIKSRQTDPRKLARITKTTKKPSVNWVFDLSDPIRIKVERWARLGKTGGRTYLAHTYVVKSARLTMTSASGRTVVYDFKSALEATQWAEEHLLVNLF